MGNKLLVQDLAEMLADVNKLPKNVADDFIRIFFETVISVLEEEGNVKVKGFGTFKLVDVDSRESVDVNTGERIRIDGHKKVSFTPEQALKKRINKPFEQFETVVINDGVDVEAMESLDNNTVEAASKDVEAPSSESREETTRKVEHVIPPMQMQLEIKKDEGQSVLDKQTEALAHEKKVNRSLKFILLFLLSAILCVLSYFAGYYKLLCPECEPEHKAVTTEVPPVKVERRVDKDTVSRKKKLPDVRKPDKMEEKPDEPRVLDPGKSYRMVSTLAVHEMKAGDNLYRIAEKYYGSKSFVTYIIRYNGIEDPNVVYVGSKVKLPLLKEQ